MNPGSAPRSTRRVALDLADDSFVVAPPVVLNRCLRAALTDPAESRRWWPGLTLAVHRDRGVLGVRFTVTGAIDGSGEVWLEPFADGTVVHYYLRGQAQAGRRERATAVARRRTLAWKRVVAQLQDRLERGRRPGEPSRHPAASVPEPGRASSAAQGRLGAAGAGPPAVPDTLTR